MSHQVPESPKIPPSESNTVQKLVENFLYYVQAVYPTMLVALKNIALEQANIIQAMAKSVTQMLNYSAMHS